MLTLHHTRTSPNRLTRAAEAAAGMAYACKPTSGRQMFADIEALATRQMR